ncbi:MAG: hypothetical protein OXH93_13570 [Caldilineaceae bacterium]|nr:hypothetical protein [Caldilineaceae bacterium]MDE0463439.1 hypothetical protein [Caldilineaceae bacterium]
MQNKNDPPNLKAAHNPRVRTSAEYRKTAQVSVGVTPNDKRRLIAAAEASDKRFSDFVRDVLLHAVAQVEEQETRQ